MKHVLLIATAAAAISVTGCQKAANTSDNATAPEAANASVATPAAMVTANGSTPGLFEVTQKNGTKGQSRLNADGTYTDMDAKGKVTAKGTWDVTGGKTCFHPEGKAADCYTETAPGPDGSFTATSEKGETVTVKKIS